MLVVLRVYGLQDRQVCAAGEELSLDRGPLMGDPSDSASIASRQNPVTLVNYVIYTHGRRLFPEDKKRKSVFPTQRETSC
jgi:hypothetical protein